MPPSLLSLGSERELSLPKVFIVCNELNYFLASRKVLVITPLGEFRKWSLTSFSVFCGSFGETWSKNARILK